MKSPVKTILLLLVAALALGAGLQALFPIGQFLLGWLAGSLLSFLGGLALWGGWRLAGGGRWLAWMTLLAFALRLGAGAGLAVALPVAGYPQPEQQAGYSSKDAFRRDGQAWQLANSGESLVNAFTDPDYSADQYGGMLALSALVYGALSPDAHRPVLILILTAAAAGLGVPFLWAAVRRRWGMRTAAIATWIFTVYPESIFWGGSQMREPVLITLTAVAFWGIAQLRGNANDEGLPQQEALPGARNWKAGLVGLAAGLAGLFLFSSTVALAVVGVLAVLAWLEFLPEKGSRAWQVAGWLGLAVGAIALVVSTWGWLRSSASYDLLLTQKSSGQLEYLFKHSGDWLRAGVVILYGVVRPVLPAAIFDAAPLALQFPLIVRALGWYLLMPLLLYGTFSVWRAAPLRERRYWVWLSVIVWVWVLIASTRAGGDASDNPRYRVIFIVWMALLASRAWVWASAHRFRWLGRLLAVEGVCLAVFTYWYIARYLRAWQIPPMGLVIGLILVLSAAVLAVGWLQDRRRARKTIGG